VPVLIDPTIAARAEETASEAEAVGRTLGIQVKIFHASTSGELNAAFAAMVRERSDALLVGPGPFFVVRRTQLSNLAARHAIPASFSVREIVDAGGLMSYGTDINDAYRQAGLYTGRILKGEKPADLPVVQSTKFELVINLQTAKMLGLDVAATLLARADEVIE
jgi:putative ABC transport system substrate-binding protein